MLVDVSVPEIVQDSLTYETEAALPAGSRVIVEVHNSLYAGIVLGVSLRKVFDLKPIVGVIDDCMKVDPDLWDLVKWSSHVCLCGMSASLRATLPRNFWMGEELEAPPKISKYDWPG